MLTSIHSSLPATFPIFQPGVKFWWDIQIMDDWGIYVTPQAKAGPGFAAGGGGVDLAFNLQLGCEGKLIFKDRGLMFLRLFTADLMLTGEVALNHDIILGGGVTF